MCVNGVFEFWLLFGLAALGFRTDYQSNFRSKAFMAGAIPHKQTCAQVDQARQGCSQNQMDSCCIFRQANVAQLQT